MRKLLAGLALFVAASVAEAQVLWVRYATMAQRPTCDAAHKDWVASVSDATSEDDCDTGGATGNSRKQSICVCVWTAGSSAYAWTAMTGSGGGGGGSEFEDSAFRVLNDGDNTKELAFDVSGVATGTTRTIVVPNSNGTMALTSSNVATATALAANGANCSAGNYPLGVDASGAVESCTAAATGTIGGTLGILDNAITRADSTGGATAQGSNVFVTDGTTPMIQLGGTTSSFPGIRRAAGAANTEFVNADASAYMMMNALGADFFPSIGGSRRINIYAGATFNEISLANDTQYKIASGSSSGGGDIGWARNAAGVWRASDGSTGLGSVLSGVLVEANTAGSGAPNVLTATESRTTLTNEGASAQNYHTLPTAPASSPHYEFTFVVADADGIRVTAASGDVIHLGGLGALGVALESSAGGHCDSIVIGDSLTLRSVNATDWFAVAVVGIGWTCA